MAKTLARCGIWLAILSCATAPTDSLSTLAPTRAAPPVDLRDSILQIAIRDVIVDSPANARRVSLQPPPGVNPARILPTLPGITFVILDSHEFQRLADRSGAIIPRLVVDAPRLFGDSAIVDIWDEPVVPRDSARVSSGGGCTRILKRSTHGWSVDERGPCIFLN